MTLDVDVVELASRLISVDSVSRKSNVPVADVLEPVLRAARFAVERLDYRDASGELKVDLIGQKGREIGGLAFLSHLDTVPSTGWDRDPWSPVIEGDRLI